MTSVDVLASRSHVHLKSFKIHLTLALDFFSEDGPLRRNKSLLYD